MNFIEAVKSAIFKYVIFSGRARRSEYWYFTLMTLIVRLPLTVFHLTVVGRVWSVATLLPKLAVTWRRLHDVGKSGAWFLIAIVPVIGPILLLVWLCKDSQPGENMYGPSPKCEL